MRNILHPCALFLLLTHVFPFSGVAQTQEEKFNLVTGTNGISIGKINSIIQDKYGFIWLSDQTNASIVRFDGSQMIRYKNDVKNPNSLGGQHPECMATDSTGAIWIGFFGMGLDYFDPRTGIFTHYRHNPDDSTSLADDFVSAVLIDHLGNLWVGTWEGLDLLDPKTGTFTHYRHKDNDPTSLSYSVVRAIYEDKAGDLWIGTGFPFANNTFGGLNLFHRESGTFTQYLHDPKNPHSLIHNKVRAIFEDSRGTFWIGTQGDGLHTMDRKTGVFTRLIYNPEKPEQLSRPPVASQQDHITFITEDSQKKIWIGTLQNGIIRYDPVSKHITNFGNNQDKTNSLRDHSGWWAFASPDGLIWISTEEANLYNVDIDSDLIPFIEINGARGFSDIYEDSDGVILFGTENGLVKKDLAKDITTVYEIDPKNKIGLKNKVRQIYKDSSGSFWIGTMDGLFLFNPKSKTFTPFFHDSNVSTTLSNNDVISFLQDDDSTLWVGTLSGGLDYLHIRSKKFDHFKNNRSDSTSISSNLVSTIAKDITGDLWVGMGHQGGINRMSRGTKIFKTYLLGLNTYAFYQDASGVIWIGTDGGLFQYDRKSDTFSSIHEKIIDFEIPPVRSIVEDNQHNLWVATAQGIFKINEQRDHAVLFGKGNGVTESDAFYYGAAIKLSGGEFLFGTLGGYYAFHPEKLETTIGKNSLHLAGFWIGSEEVKPRANGPLRESILDAKEIKLDHDQNVFSFSFTSIDFRNTGKVNIYYKLENYDADWHSAPQGSKIQYFKVPPGDYILHIKNAIRNDTGTGKSISITIFPPWWNTIPAYVGYSLLFLSVVYVVHRIQKNRVIQAEREKTRERELEQKKEIEKAYTELKSTQSQLIQSEKMASLGELTAGIAHEIQNPLNFVNNFSEINAELISEMKEELSKGNVDGAKTIATSIDENEKKIVFHGKRADAIVKGMLQHSRSNSGQKEPTDINALADEYLRLTYHGLRAKDKSFSAKFETDLDPTVGKINVAAQDIGRVFLNLLNNAFYAVNERKSQAVETPLEEFEPTVTLKTKKLGNKVEVKIIDNGNGIPGKVQDKIFQPFFTTKPTGQGTGLGLSISYDIITKGHGGELKVETREGEGTVFTIILPG